MQLERVLSKNKAPAQIRKVPTRMIKTNKRVKLPTVASNLPAPANGTEYTPKETIKLLKGYPEKSKQKSHLIKHMVASNIVPIQRNRVYKLLCKKRSMKRIRKEWGQCSRSKVLGNQKQIN